MGLAVSLRAQAIADDEAIPLAQQVQMTADWPQWRWSILAGDDALKSGLASMADDLYQQVLAEAIPDSARRAVQLKRVSALIAERDFLQAEAILQAIEPKSGAAYWLREAIISFSIENHPAARQALERVRAGQLPRQDQPWYHLLKGLLAKEDGDLETSSEALERAMADAVSPAQEAHFETILLTTRLESDKDLDELLSLLKDKTEANMGTRPGFGYAREYAVALDRAGQKSQAIEVLQRQLTLVRPGEDDEKAQSLMMIALIAGADSRRGQLALEEILSSSNKPSDMRIALYLLADGERDAEGQRAFMAFLDQLIASGEHPVGDELLMLRARIRLAEGKTEAAAEDADRLLSEYPASSFRTDARWLLAYLAWQEKRYRSAADYLQQIRVSMGPGDEWRFLGQLVADCYFLNGDYETAAGIYQGILQDGAEQSLAPSVGYQYIIALIRMGNYHGAAESLDRLIANNQISPDYRWRAEWNLVEALRRANETTEAFARLSEQLSGTPISRLQPDLRLRLMWLSAFLSFEAGRYRDVPVIVRGALGELREGEAAELPPGEKQTLASSLTLLEGQAQLRSGQGEAGMATLARLRQAYPQTEAAVRSYLIEARYLAREYRSAEAQLRLRALADAHPDSPQAPVALLEAAMMAEKQGQARNYEEATEILKRLLERYPEHPAVFHAKLRLGNLYRKMNQFGVAQILYESLLKDYEGREEDFPLYLAELYRADSLLAQAGGDSARLDGAAEGLDRVMDDPTTPLGARIEAGYKQAQIQVRQGNLSRARETIWLMVTRYLKDPQEYARLGARGRYWLSRGLLELGRMMEESGDTQEAQEVYRHILDYELPGQALVRSRLQGT